MISVEAPCAPIPNFINFLKKGQFFASSDIADKLSRVERLGDRSAAIIGFRLHRLPSGIIVTFTLTLELIIRVEYHHEFVPDNKCTEPVETNPP